MPRLAEGLFAADDGLARCFWCAADANYRAYHDDEWGRPVTDDQRLFEKLCLEGFQSGLSWLTILRKREAFRRAFARFDVALVARFSERDVERLLGDAAIVRHRRKIESAINNARKALEIIAQHGSLAAYLWGFEPPARERPRRLTKRALTALTHSTSSERLARDLKRRGFSFVGPTTMYALMQAMGLVNDHIEGCHVRPLALAERAALTPPAAAQRLT